MDGCRCSGRWTATRAAATAAALILLVLPCWAANTTQDSNPAVVHTEAELQKAVLGGATNITVNATLILLTDFISANKSWSKSVFPPVKDSNLTIRCSEAYDCELRVAATLNARLFRVQKGGLLRVEGLVLSGGSVAGSGGALLIEEHGRAEFDKVEFVNNIVTSATQARGGAVFIDGGTARFSGVTFERNGFVPANFATMYGGAVFIRALEGQGMKEHMECRSCIFRNNTASHGGAVALTGIAEIAVSGSAFEANYASVAGGALYSGPSLNSTLSYTWRRARGNNVVITGSFFVSNSAGAEGGATHFKGLNTWLFSRCEFHYNNAGEPGEARTSLGGAVRATGHVDVRLYGSFDSCIFRKNSAHRGGSVAVSGMLEGALGWSNCSFSGDRAHVAGGSVWLYHIMKPADFHRCGFEGSEGSGGGGAIWANNTSLRLRLSTLGHNSAEAGGAVFAAGRSDATMEDCSFVFNSAIRSGGALKIADSAAVTATETNFFFNEPPRSSAAGGGAALQQSELVLEGGAVAITGDSGARVSSFYDCTFSDNLAAEGGAVMVTARANLFRCTFRSNVAKYGGALKALNASSLSATACNFTKNIAQRSGGGAEVVSSVVQFKKCKFESNRALDDDPGTDELGGGLHVTGAMDEMAVKLQECSFRDNHATYGGGAFLGAGASVRMDNSDFAANTAERMGGAVRIGALPGPDGDDSGAGAAEAEFAGVSFANHTANKGAGAIDVWGSKAILFHCSFDRNSAVSSSEDGSTSPEEQWGGAVRIQGRRSEVDFDACTFTRNTAPYGGAVYAGLGGGILFTACTFEANSARLGGAVRIESAAEVMASECTFRQQRAAEGGALSCEGPWSGLFSGSPKTTTAWVRQSAFSLNVAEAAGGAIDARGCSIFLNSNRFIQNSVSGASGQGGGAFAVLSVGGGGGEGEVVRGQMTFEDDEFEGNAAHMGGTGSVAGAAEVSFFQARIHNSSAAGSGGGLFASGPEVQLNFVQAEIEGSVAGGDGGGVALQGGGRLFMKATALRRCRSGAAAAAAVASWLLGANGTALDDPQAASRGLALAHPAATGGGMGGALSLLGGSVAVLEKQCELSGNSAGGAGGGIAAVGSQLVARQTVFKGNRAATGGGGLYSSGSKVMLVNGPRFEGNAAAVEVQAESGDDEEEQEPEEGEGGGGGSGRRRRRGLLQLLPPLVAEVVGAGGALHFAGDSRGVCEQCEFEGNSAPEGGDAYIGPEVLDGSVVLSTGRLGAPLQLFPRGSAWVNSGSCWPLHCSLDPASASTTTCGQDALHKDQLTGGTSSVGFAESVAITTQVPTLIVPPGGSCDRKCLDATLLLLPVRKCRALDGPASDGVSLLPSDISRTGRTGSNSSISPSINPTDDDDDPTEGSPISGGPVIKDDSEGPSVQIWLLAAFLSIVSVASLCVLAFFVAYRIVRRRQGAADEDPHWKEAPASGGDIERTPTATSQDLMIDKNNSELGPVTTSSSQETDADTSKAGSSRAGGQPGQGDDGKTDSGGVDIRVKQVRWAEGTVSNESPEVLPSILSTSSLASQLQSYSSAIGHRDSLPVFPHELEVDWDQMLGSGAFGQVYTGHWTPVGQPGQGRDVAVKVMTPSRNDKERADKARSFQEEAGMMGRFRGCKRIVEMIAADVNNPVCWIVYELLPNGTLAERVHNLSLPPLGLLSIVRIALDIAVGLQELHKVSVVHRDLKPDNVLLDHENRPKLIDFGISRERNNDKTSITTDCVGTWSYMAPEQFSNRVSEKVDVYALGITLWEMYTRQRPWKDLLEDSPWQLVIAVMNDDERLPIPSSCPKALRALIEDLWLPDPRKRPAMHEVVERLVDMRARLERGVGGRSSSMDGFPVLEDPQLAALINRLAGGSPFRKGKALLRRFGSGPRRPMPGSARDRLRNPRTEAQLHDDNHQQQHQNQPGLRQRHFQQQQPQQQGEELGGSEEDAGDDDDSTLRTQSAHDLTSHMGPSGGGLETFNSARALEEHHREGSPLGGSPIQESPLSILIGHPRAAPPSAWVPPALPSLEASPCAPAELSAHPVAPAANPVAGAAAQ